MSDPFEVGNYERITTPEDAWYEKAGYDFDLDAANDYMADQIAAAFDEHRMDSARTYLGQRGDAITARVDRALTDARALVEAGFPGAALVAAHTAVEVIVRELVIRPILQGAFLSNEWAEILADQVLRERGDLHRSLLPQIAEGWGLDLSEVRLPDAAAVWGVFTGQITPLRNRHVHRGVAVDPEVAAKAIACGETLLAGLVQPLAKSLGMNWPANPWHMSHAVGGITISLFQPVSDEDAGS